MRFLRDDRYRLSFILSYLSRLCPYLICIALAVALGEGSWLSRESGCPRERVVALAPDDRLRAMGPSLHSRPYAVRYRASCSGFVEEHGYNITLTTPSHACYPFG